LVMAHLWFAEFVFIQRRLSLFPANFVQRQHLSWARGSSFSREWPVNSPFGNGLRGCLRGLNFGNAWGGRRQKHCSCELLCRAPRRFRFSGRADVSSSSRTPRRSVGRADRCDDHAVRLRGLRSREGCETKGGGSRTSSESFGRNSHDEPRMLCV